MTPSRVSKGHLYGDESSQVGHISGAASRKPRWDHLAKIIADGTGLTENLHPLNETFRGSV